MIGKILVFTIKVYQTTISPLFPGKCRFYPTCSSYCIQAIEKYGVLKGLFLGVRRVAKCHPFHPGGFDPLR